MNRKYLTERSPRKNCLPERETSYSQSPFSGLMCYQGLRKFLAESGLSMDVRGTVMDSCPGPRASLEAPSRAAIVLAIAALCGFRDVKNGASATVAANEVFQ